MLIGNEKNHHLSVTSRSSTIESSFVDDFEENNDWPIIVDYKKSSPFILEELGYLLKKNDERSRRVGRPKVMILFILVMSILFISIVLYVASTSLFYNGKYFQVQKESNSSLEKADHLFDKDDQPTTAEEMDEEQKYGVWDEDSFRKALVDSTFFFVHFYVEETQTWDIIAEVMSEAKNTLQNKEYEVQEDFGNFRFAQREYETALKIKPLVSIAKVDCSKYLRTICTDFNIELPQMRFIFYQGESIANKTGEESVMSNLLWLKQVVAQRYFESLPKSGVLSFEKDINTVTNHWGSPLNKWNMCCGSGHYCSSCYGQSCCYAEPECCKMETYDEECCNKAEGKCYWGQCIPCPAGTYSPVGGHYYRYGDDSTCPSCPEGTTSEEGAVSCYAVPD